MIIFNANFDTPVDTLSTEEIEVMLDEFAAHYEPQPGKDDDPIRWFFRHEWIEQCERRADELNKEFARR